MWAGGRHGGCDTRSRYPKRNGITEYKVDYEVNRVGIIVWEQTRLLRHSEGHETRRRYYTDTVFVGDEE